jgi:hypothetical protein
VAQPASVANPAATSVIFNFAPFVATMGVILSIDPVGSLSGAALPYSEGLRLKRKADKENAREA